MSETEINSFKQVFLYQMQIKLTENTRSVMYTTLLDAEKFTNKYLKSITHLRGLELQDLERKTEQVVVEFLNYYEKHLLSFAPEKQQ